MPAKQTTESTSLKRKADAPPPAAAKKSKPSDSESEFESDWESESESETEPVDSDYESDATPAPEAKAAAPEAKAAAAAPKAAAPKRSVPVAPKASGSDSKAAAPKAVAPKRSVPVAPKAVSESDSKTAAPKPSIAAAAPKKAKVRTTPARILAKGVTEVPKNLMQVAIAINDVLRRTKASAKEFEEIGRSFGLFEPNAEMARTLHIYLNGESPDRRDIDAHYRKMLQKFNESVGELAPHRAKLAKLLKLSKRSVTAQDVSGAASLADIEAEIARREAEEEDDDGSEEDGSEDESEYESD